MPSRARGVRRSTRRGFSIVDLLVSLTVITVLMGLLLPTLSGVREISRRVACSSNVRQFGLGVAMYADDHREYIPPSFHVTLKAEDPANKPQLMMQARLEVGVGSGTWDGLGVLFNTGYASAAGVFYCPSHLGEHPYSVYESAWMRDEGLIVGNYHYRGVNAAGNSNRISAFTAGSTIVADGLATERDYNHRVGNNALRADLGVLWVPDERRMIITTIPKDGTEGNSPFRVRWAWTEIDRIAGAANGTAPEMPPG